MKKTDIATLAQENAFDLIGKEWMLVTGGTKENFNMMTASWGGIGYLWNKPVAFIFIRPERATYPLLEQSVEHVAHDYFVNVAGYAAGIERSRLTINGYVDGILVGHGLVFA